jgi:hypothetical protein
MLEFRHGNTSLDSQGVKVQLNILNSAIEEGFINGSYTQEFVFPFTPTNDKFFNFSRYIETKNKRRKYEDIELRFKGSPKMRGFIELMKISSKGYHCSFSVNGFVSSDLDISLKEVNYGPDIDMGTNQAAVLSYAKARSAQTYPQTTHVFPIIRALNFYGEANPGYWGNINHWRQEDQTFAANTMNTSEYNRNTLVPQFFLMYLIESTLKHLGYSYSGNFFNDNRLQKLLVFNNFALDRKNEKFRFAHLRRNTQQEITINNNYQTIAMDRVEDLSSAWDVANNSYHVQFVSDFQMEATVTPVRLSGHAGQLVKLFLTAFNNNTNTREILDEKEIDLNRQSGTPVTLSGSFSSTSSTTWTHLRLEARWHFSLVKFAVRDAEMRVTDIKASNLNVFSRYLKISNHAPDISFSELLSELNTLFGLNFNFDFKNRHIRIDFCQDIFNKTPLDYTKKTLRKNKENLNFYLSQPKGVVQSFDFEEDQEEILPIPEISFSANTKLQLPSVIGNLGRFALAKDENMVYVAGGKMNITKADWRKYTYNHGQRKTGEGQKELKIKAAPMLMIRFAASIIPLYNGAGTSLAFGIQNQAPLRLMFYHGMQQGSAANYPFASSGNINFKGQEIQNLSLTLESIGKEFTDKWLNTQINGEVVTERLLLSESDIDSIDTTRKCRIENQEYIIKSVKILLENDQVKISEAELLRIP